jgi:hypothetical protein
MQFTTLAQIDDVGAGMVGLDAGEQIGEFERTNAP